MDVLGSASFQRLESAVRAASMRQQVIANNIANVDTPYYKRSDVAFEEVLAQAIGDQGTNGIAIKRTDPRHLPSANVLPSPQVVEDDSTSINNNRNNVDIDKEMSLLAENQLRYNLLIQQINHDVTMMRTAIQGRN